MSKSDTESETADDSGLTEPGDRSGVFRAYHDPDGAGVVSDTVIEAIAEVAGVDPTKTVIPLGDCVDPDALDALFMDSGGDAQVTFRVCGLEVLVRSDGRIRILDQSVVNAE